MKYQSGSAYAVLCLAVILLAACSDSGPAVPPVSEQSETMGRLVAAMLEATGGNVPGLAVAVVKDADLVYLRGFGLADVENNVPVDGDTPFYIASSTKPFTALATAMLDRDGILELDAPISTYAGDASFHTDVRADEVTVRDLLSHTSGLANPAMVTRTAFTGDHSPEVLWRLLSATEPSANSALGEFDYTNVGYNILSLFIDAQTGKNWQDVLDERVFEPAGLHNTTAYASEARGFDRPVAEPYVAFGGDGTASRSYLAKRDNTMHAAGGMYTSARDASRWIEAQLNEGVIDGDQVFPAEIIRAMHTSAADVDAAFGDFQRDGYGLGWYLGGFGNDLAGERHIHHLGGFGGTHSHISFLPERGLGVAVFVNESGMGGRVAMSIANLAYRLWLDREGAVAEAEQFVDEVAMRVSQFTERVAADRANRASREWTLLQPADKYAGTYVNELFGTAVVTSDGEAPRIQIGNMVATSSPASEEDAVRVELIPMRGEIVRFEVGADGTVRSLSYDGVRYQRAE